MLRELMVFRSNYAEMMVRVIKCNLTTFCTNFEEIILKRDEIFKNWLSSCEPVVNNF